MLDHQIWLMCISPSTYIAACLFFAFMGTMYLTALLDVSVNPGPRSPMELFLSVFWVPVLFMVPLITMRSLSEERRMGTLSALMTTSVTAGQIVLAKFLAAYLFYVLLWLLTLAFPLIAYWYLGDSAAAALFNPWQALTGYSFIFVSGAMYVAIGMFASSLTRTTLVAGMLSCSMLFFSIVGAGLIAKFAVSDFGSGGLLPMDYIRTFRHLEDFSKSLLDTRPFFFYISSAGLLLAITAMVTEVKNA